MISKAKIYHDGSHYVAIKPTKRFRKPRPKRKEEVVAVIEKDEENNVKIVEKPTYTPTFKIKEGNMSAYIEQRDFSDLPLVVAAEKYELEQKLKEQKKDSKPVRTATRSQLFNEFFEQSKSMPKKKQIAFLIENMRKYFSNDLGAEIFVSGKLYRMKENQQRRKLRFIRKANMANFNYFVTFTYDSEKHTEESFKKKLRKTLQNLQQRNGWLYMGVWERSPENDRLHFHGLLKISDGKMVGELFEKKDYNTTTKRMQITTQNTYFNERFGRCDFKPLIDNVRAKAEAFNYILKYLEKTGEKLVYSRGLPIFVIADVNDDDVLVEFEDNANKVVLYDKFTCYDEETGEILGEMNDETKKKLQTANA